MVTEKRDCWHALVLMAAVSLLTLGAPRAWASDSGEPHATGVEDLSFPPPDFAFRQNYTEFAGYVAAKLDLASLDIANASTGVGAYECCLVSWERHYVGVLYQTDLFIRPTTPNETSLWLAYSPSDILEEVTITGSIGAPLSSNSTTAMTQRTTEIAQQLGLPSPSGIAVRAVTGAGPEGPEPAVKVSYFLNYSGKSIAFANELSVTFGTLHADVLKTEVFPWFSPRPPVISEEAAYARALDMLGGHGVRNVTGKGIYLAFNSINASLAYQVEAEITSPDFDPAYPVGDYRVWVDAYDGTIAYEVWLEPPPGPTAPTRTDGYGFVLISVFGILLAVSFALWAEPVRLGLLLLVVPLYARLKRESALDHFVRGQVYGFVASHEGATFSEIRDAFSLSNGTVTYHLAVLEKLGFIRGISDGKFKRFVPTGEGRGALGRKLTDLQYRILNLVVELEPVAPSEIATHLGLSRQRAAYHMGKLVTFGFLLRDNGRRGTYRASETARDELADATHHRTSA